MNLVFIHQTNNNNNNNNKNDTRVTLCDLRGLLTERLKRYTKMFLHILLFSVLIQKNYSIKVSSAKL